MGTLRRAHTHRQGSVTTDDASLFIMPSRSVSLLLLFLTASTGRQIIAGRLQAFNEHGEDPHTLPYQLFIPSLPRTSALELLPMIVFLHGAGDGPFEEMNKQSLPGLLLRNASFARDFPFIALFPCSTCGFGGTRGWDKAAFERTDKLIAMAMHSHGADPTRIFLTGQSMGGGGLWRYAAARPTLFAALVPVCAAMRTSPQLVNEICCAQGPKGGCCPPIWAFHGANDGSVPVEATDGTIELLRGLGRGQEIKYTRYEWAPPPPMPEYASMEGHGSYEYAYREAALYAWLLQQRCTACKGPPEFLELLTKRARQHQHV